MNLKKIVRIVSILVFFIGILVISNFSSPTKAIDSQEMIGNSKTAHELVKEIKIGYNIGNTLDSANYKKEFLGTEKGVSYYETLWHNPRITEDLIIFLKNAGFDSIRLPITYYDHIKEDGTIDSLWLERVASIVDFIIKNDMYCIIDIHHDSGLFEGGSWIKADADNYENTANNLRNMWGQIATYFKDYDYRLIFEGFNEIIDKNKNYSWNYGYENVLVVNKLNQVFVNTVRETGSKNLDRFLIVSTYAAITDEQKLKAFKMPVDIAEDKLILGLHDYATSFEEIQNMLNRINTFIISRDIPIVLDEFGTKNDLKENTRAEIAKNYVSMAHYFNIPCYWWDNGGDYALIDRKNLTWKYESIKDAMMSVFKTEEENENEKDKEDKEDKEYNDDKEEIKNPIEDKTKLDESIIEEPIVKDVDLSSENKANINDTEGILKEEIKQEKISSSPIISSEIVSPIVNKDQNTKIIKEEISKIINVSSIDNSNLNNSSKEEVKENKENLATDEMLTETLPITSSLKINNIDDNSSNRLIKLSILLIILTLLIFLTILLNYKIKNDNNSKSK